MPAVYRADFLCRRPTDRNSFVLKATLNLKNFNVSAAKTEETYRFEGN